MTDREREAGDSEQLTADGGGAARSVGPLRDWLIAAGSVIPIFGVAAACYLAWRDVRVRWMRLCGVLLLASLVSLVLPAFSGTENVFTAIFVLTWLGGIVAAVTLAATVGPEHRRTSAAELAARRRAARRAGEISRRLASAGIAQDDPRVGGGTALTEPVILIEGTHRGNFALSDRHDHALGIAHSAEPQPAGCRARYELRAPDGSLVLALHIAGRYGPEPDVILAADDTPLVRLQRTVPRAGPPRGRDWADAMKALGAPPSRRWRVLRANSLGFASRSLLDGQRPIGELHRAAGRRRGHAARVLTDAAGTDVARVTRSLGGPGPGGDDCAFVIDIQEGTDDRLRATALFTGVLWDWNIISWAAGG